MAPQSAEFKKAVADSRKLKAKPSDTELLEVRIPNIPPNNSRENSS